jgi:hypothetical protein
MRGATRVLEDQGYSKYSTEAITSGLQDQGVLGGTAHPTDVIAEHAHQIASPR